MIREMAKRSISRRGSKSNKKSPDLWVAAALPGLEDLLKVEIERKFKDQVSFIPHARAAECHFLFKGRPTCCRSGSVIRFIVAEISP